MTTFSCHAISTGKQSLKEWLDISVTIHPYIDAVHIREKSWSDFQIENAVSLLKEKGVPAEKIRINQHVNVAARAGVSGVHLPENYENMEAEKAKHPSLLFGCSVHSKESAVRKEKAGADYLFFGHVYRTTSKQGLEPRGVSSLSSIASTVNIPVIAIGGIQPEHTEELYQAGASGLAVLSGIYMADDPEKAAWSYRQSIQKVVQRGETKSL